MGGLFGDVSGFSVRNGSRMKNAASPVSRCRPTLYSGPSQEFRVSRLYYTARVQNRKPLSIIGSIVRCDKRIGYQDSFTIRSLGCAVLPHKTFLHVPSIDTTDIYIYRAFPRANLE